MSLILVSTSLFLVAIGLSGLVAGFIIGRLTSYNPASDLPSSVGYPMAVQSDEIERLKELISLKTSEAADWKSAYESMRQAADSYEDASESHRQAYEDMKSANESLRSVIDSKA